MTTPDANLTRVQRDVLFVLNANPDIQPYEIKNHINDYYVSNITHSGVVKALSRLEALDHVTPDDNPDGSKFLTWRLTPSGEEWVDSRRKTEQEIHQQLNEAE